ncbi:MAG: thiamine phosphate synthase [Gammaproteobacteria bacterium]
MISGLYAVTTAFYQDTPDLVERTADIVEGGACAVLYRDKNSPAETRLEQANALRDVCQQHKVPLLINDDIDLAHRVGASGVHVGKNDSSLAEARAVLGSKAIIGVSCYASMRRAVQAQQHGANYVSFGSLYKSTTKPLAEIAPVNLISSARELLDVNVIAIGGITLDNAPSVIDAGAHAVAATTALYGAENSKQTAQAFAAFFEPAPEH